MLLSTFARKQTYNIAAVRMLSGLHRRRFHHVFMLAYVLSMIQSTDIGIQMSNKYVQITNARRSLSVHPLMHLRECTFAHTAEYVQRDPCIQSRKLSETVNAKANHSDLPPSYIGGGPHRRNIDRTLPLS